MNEKQQSTPNLLDVNLWLAVAWDLHPHHAVAIDWFRETVREHQPGLFCRITQLGLLRLLTQRRVMVTDVLTQRQAWGVYKRLLDYQGVTFEVEPQDLQQVLRQISSRDEISPNRWTDDYLSAFAQSANLTLVTLDKALAARTPGSLLLKS